jgi:hypothetical protein
VRGHWATGRRSSTPLSFLTGEILGCRYLAAVTSPRRTGYANLRLHGGRTPPWLFERMVRLARAIVAHTVSEHSPEELLRRLSDPRALNGASIDRSDRVSALKRLSRLA